jgi:hypothetical protein
MKKERLGNAIDKAKEEGIVVGFLWSNICKLRIILVGLKRETLNQKDR